MEPIGIKDFLNYKFLSNVKYAPDGKRAAFVVYNCNEEENSYESRLPAAKRCMRSRCRLRRRGSKNFRTAPMPCSGGSTQTPRITIA